MILTSPKWPIYISDIVDKLTRANLFANSVEIFEFTVRLANELRCGKGDYRK